MMLLALLLGSNLPPRTTQCPNMCSGHGDCGADNVCQCFDGYDFAADCSMRAFGLTMTTPLSFYLRIR